MLAFLHADGVVRLRDMGGEEIVSFNAGHGTGVPTAEPSPAGAASSASAVESGPSKEEAATTVAGAETARTPVAAVGLAADTSEAGPVLVTAGADGTARVHSLAVHYRGKQVAGAGMRGDRARRDSSSRGSAKRKEETLGGAGGSDGRGSGSSGSSSSSGSGSSTAERMPQKKAPSAGKTSERDGSSGGKRRSVSPPPATAMGVGIAVEFKTCLGSACSGFEDGSQIQGAEAAGVNASGGDADATSGSLPAHGGAATVTSMDAYYHRS